MNLSIIIPLYEEEKNVPLLHAAISKSLESAKLLYEIIFVDDGSRDGTFAQAKAIADSDRRVKIIKFRRNYGQTAAMSAGIRAASGDIVVTMDGDLQNDPEDIPLLVSKIVDEGYHIAIGWRHMRQDDRLRVWVSMVANWIIGKVSGVPVKDLGCSLKAYDAELIKNIPLYSEMHRFIPVMTSITGARLAEVKVHHHPRRFGRSKYGFSRILKVMLDIVSIRFLLSFVQHPVLWSAGSAVAATAVGLFFLAFGAVEAVLHDGSDNLVLSAIGILFLTLGIILFAWGLIGYLMVVSTKNHPLSRLSAVSWNLASRLAQPPGARHVQ